MAGVGGCSRRCWLGAGRPGTGLHGRIHRVHQDRHHHLSHDNHVVGGCDERAAVAEGGTEDRASFKSAVRRRTSEKSSTRQLGEYRRVTRREPAGTRYRTFARVPLSSASPPLSEAGGGGGGEKGGPPTPPPPL